YDCACGGAMKLTRRERLALQRQASARNGRADSARHARLVLLLAENLTWAEIQEKLDCSDSYISRWSKRFAADRLASLFEILDEELLAVEPIKERGRTPPRPQKAFLALPELRLVTFALDRYSDEMRHLLNYFLIVFSWASRFAPVDLKGTRRQTIRRQYR